MLETIAEPAPPARNLISSSDAPPEDAGITGPMGETRPGASAQ